MEYTTQIIKGDGFTVIVERPILTPEEREARIEEVRTALVGSYFELLRIDEELAELLVHKDYKKKRGD